MPRAKQKPRAPRPGPLSREFIKDQGQNDGTDPQLKPVMRALKRFSARRSMSRGIYTAAALDSGGKGGKGSGRLPFDDEAVAAFREAVSDKVAFYKIPKVKFAMWFASHVLYTLLLTDLGIYFSEDKKVWQESPRPSELLFYVWSFARLVSEAGEFGSFTTFRGFVANLKGYMEDQWNQLDALFNLCTRAAPAR